MKLVRAEGIDPAYFPKIKDEWQRFLAGEKVNKQMVPSEVIESWERSRSYGIDPYGTDPHPVNLSGKEYKKLQEILNKYGFFFERIVELVEQDGLTLYLNTVDGLNYHLFRSGGMSGHASLGHCNEKTVGTTASCLAKLYNQPILLVHPYRYSQNYTQNHGVSAPIHNEKNEVIGALGLGFEDPRFCLQAYSMISFIAQAFDSLYLPLTNGYEKHMQKIIDCMPHGVAFVDERDTVQLYNNKILELLKIRRKNNIEGELNKQLARLGVGAGFKDKQEAEVTCAEIQVDNEKPYKLILLKDRLEGRKPGIFPSPEGEGKGKGLFTFDQIIGESVLLKEAKKVAANVARTSVPVMIHGESGTGKEMFAQAMHCASPRRNGPFVAINCGALPGELVESELFGYEEGSFTGALKGGRIGKVEAASGGTLFLDEIESVPLKDQIKLLRVLSTGKVQKIGSTKEIQVDVRIVAATKIDLLKHADDGLFREDLFYRISTFIIELPALRQRKEDIGALAEYFIKKLASKYDRGKIKMDPVFVDALQRYYWRGNVRELEHAMERAIIMLEDGETLMLEHLSPGIQQAYRKRTVEKLVAETVQTTSHRQGLLELAERRVIEYVLELVDGNQSLAAQQLGINRRTLYTKLNGKSNSGREVLDA